MSNTFCEGSVAFVLYTIIIIVIYFIKESTPSIGTTLTTFCLSNLKMCFSQMFAECYTISHFENYLPYPHFIIFILENCFIYYLVRKPPRNGISFLNGINFFNKEALL